MPAMLTMLAGRAHRQTTPAGRAHHAQAAAAIARHAGWVQTAEQGQLPWVPLCITLEFPGPAYAADGANASGLAGSRQARMLA